MNPQDILRYVDSLHREKNIDQEIVFSAIEAALQTAAKRQYGEDSDIIVTLDRKNGQIRAFLEGEPLGDDQIGRIGAQTAKQVIIQKVKEAERDALMVEYRELIGQIVNGVIGRADGGVATVQLGNVEAILPRSEQIPGETLHANERVRAVVYEVRATGNRIRVVLSRTRPQFVQRLFEQEIPELTEEVISIDAISREPGYRSKVAVSSIDSQVDPIAVCVGFRGSRIKAVREELAGEHIDVVRYSDDPQVLIPNALQPATVEQVLLCDLIGRAIVLVQEDQLSLAIGRRGQNVRLASKLCGWDIEIMTTAELEEKMDIAVSGFSSIPEVSEELAQALVEQGYLSYDDLSVIEPDVLMEMSGLTAEEVDSIVEQAEIRAADAEEAAAEERRLRRERQQVEAAQAEAQAHADALAAQSGEAVDQAEAAGDQAEAAAPQLEASEAETQAMPANDEGEVSAAEATPVQELSGTAEPAAAPENAIAGDNVPDEESQPAAEQNADSSAPSPEHAGEETNASHGEGGGSVRQESSDEHGAAGDSEVMEDEPEASASSPKTP